MSKHHLSIIAALLVAIASIAVPLAFAQEAQVAEPSTHDAYKLARQAYQEAQARYDESQQERLACTSDCGELEEKRKEDARAYLLSATTLVQEHLRLLDIYILSSVHDRELRMDLHTQIDSARATVQDARAQVQDLPARPGDEELGAAERSVQAAWGRSERITQITASRLMQRRIDASIEQLEVTASRLKLARDVAAVKGADTRELDALLAQFNEELGQARRSHASADEAYMLPAKDAVSYSSRVNAARQSLSDAVHTLQSITQEMRTLNQTEQ